ncbi:MAG: hypothetical protein JW797_17360 [Bradymonadales bacterium]|nr:hypothetical protein [Bradymonadales bacterium]
MKSIRNALLALVAALVILSGLWAGCSLLLDLKECETTEDCKTEGKICDDGVCVPE